MLAVNDYEEPFDAMFAFMVQSDDEEAEVEAAEETKEEAKDEEAAAEVAFLLQAGQQRGLHVTIAPRPAPAAESSAAGVQTMIHVSTPPRQVETPRPELV